MKKLSTLLIVALASAFVANAVPARRGLFDLAQPDGSTVKVQLVGDEYSHYYLTEDGVPALPGADGCLRYASADAVGNISLSVDKVQNALTRNVAGVKAAKAAASVSGKEAFVKAMAARAEVARVKRMARNAASRVAPQNGLGLFSGNYPRKGKVRSLVFLVNYTDVKFTTPNAGDYFSRLLNEEGFSDNGATGSARDYFLDQSLEQFDVHFDVYGPVDLPFNRRYYGGNDEYGDDANAHEMVTDAAEILADQINFADYDYDNNGLVDNIFILYAGTGEASGGPDYSVWPHSYELVDYNGNPNGPIYNGKRLYSYACSNELEGTKACGIGTFVHEFSHVMGLPDLYSTGGSNLSCTPGEWSVMDYGPYNNNGRTPPSYSIFERNAMGWLDPTVLNGPATIRLEAIDQSNSGCLIPTEYTNEFFLLENRQQQGWDKYIPGHGMLVWHIDFSQTIWDRNVVNNNPSHQYVDIVEANNNDSGSDEAMKGYAFPGTRGVTSFTSSTTPALRSWAGRAIGLPITEIAENNGVITFNVSGGKIEFDTPDAPQVTPADNGTALVKWNEVPFAKEYLLNIYTKDEGGAHHHFAAYTDYVVAGATEHTVQGLEGETEYFATIAARTGMSVSDPSDEASFTTPAVGIRHVVPTATDGSGVIGSEATFNWQPVKTAAKYFLTVEAETGSGDKEVTVDFGSGSTLTIPDGWSWTGKATDRYAASSGSQFFGEAAPSLKFAKDGVCLTSPLMDGNIQEIRFWLRFAPGNEAASGNSLRVEGRAGSDAAWVVLDEIGDLHEILGNGKTIKVVPETSARQVRFSYVKPDVGNLAFDDLTIVLPGVSYNAIEGLTHVDVGNKLSHTAAMPAGVERVRFFVEAADEAGTMSKPSNAVLVALAANSGLTGITAAADINVNVAGNLVTVKGLEGDDVRIVNLAGATVAQAIRITGEASFTLPGGFYIVATRAGAVKVVVK